MSSKKNKLVEFKVAIHKEPYFEIKKGYPLRYKGVLYYVSRDADHEFTHAKSGLGFNGNHNFNLESLKFVEKNIGVEKFDEVMSSSRDLDDHIKEMQEADKWNSKVLFFFDLLYSRIGIRAHYETIMYIVSHKKLLDVVLFDEQLKRKLLYDERKHGSMENFLRTAFNKDVADFVSMLMTGKEDKELVKRIEKQVEDLKKNRA